MGKSAEEAARQIYDDMQEDNSHEQNIAIIAAAIREDRAEPVSDRVAKLPGWAMLRARRLIEEHIRIYGMVPHPDKIKEAIAEALEAARQARATADEKGGAR